MNATQLNRDLKKREKKILQRGVGPVFGVIRTKKGRKPKKKLKVVVVDEMEEE